MVCDLYLRYANTLLLPLHQVDVLFGDEPNRSRLLRCVISKRFSNEVSTSITRYLGLILFNLNTIS